MLLQMCAPFEDLGRARRRRRQQVGLSGEDHPPCKSEVEHLALHQRAVAGNAPDREPVAAPVLALLLGLEDFRFAAGLLAVLGGVRFAAFFLVAFFPLPTFRLGLFVD